MWPLQKKGLFESGRVLFLPLDAIQPNPSQPRRAFDQPALEELASSIQELGVLQPLTVRRREGQWELVAGERRLRAARMAGLETVPCLSIQTDSQSYNPDVCNSAPVHRSRHQNHCRRPSQTDICRTVYPYIVRSLLPAVPY